jgi:hypothetical protein
MFSWIRLGGGGLPLVDILAFAGVITDVALLSTGRPTRPEGLTSGYDYPGSHNLRASQLSIYSATARLGFNDSVSFELDADVGGTNTAR